MNQKHTAVSSQPRSSAQVPSCWGSVHCYSDGHHILDKYGTCHTGLHWYPLTTGNYYGSRNLQTQASLLVTNKHEVIAVMILKINKITLCTLDTKSLLLVMNHFSSAVSGGIYKFISCLVRNSEEEHWMMRYLTDRRVHLTHLNKTRKML